MPRNDGKAGRLEGSREPVPAKTSPRLAAVLAALRALQGGAPRFDEIPGSKLVSAVAEHGVRYAYHLQRETTAFRKRRRADMRPHLLARLNLAATRPGTRLKAVLEGLGAQDIHGLDYALLEQQGEHAVALFGRLRLTEITDLYTYFRYWGDFRTASWLRIQALEANLREQERVKHVMPSALVAALEQARPDLILEIVDAKPTRGRDRLAVDEVTAMAHALCGDVERAERIWSRTFGDRDRAFGSALRGRSVAVVGPAAVSADLGREIDSFDLIARTNYLGAVNPSHGSRTDISYYNGVRIRTRPEQICAVAPTLSWLVSVRSDDAQLRQLLPRHPGVRTGHSAARLFLDANPLAIPNILTDLVRFQPLRIKLFGMDFFTSPTAYGKDYHAQQAGSDAISHSIRVHEGFSSFRFVQQLKRAGLCDADARLGQVLDMSREQYAARLQELHGHGTVTNRPALAKWHTKPVGS
jgi:hypothetical protein